VQEVLERLLTPALSRQLLGDALNRAGRARFPEDPVEAAQVIEGPLRELVEELFGDDTAAFVVLDLAPVLQLASSGVRRRSDTERALDARRGPTSRSPIRDRKSVV